MALLKSDVFDFLRTSRKFCKQIQKYNTLLGLDSDRVENYIYDNRFFTGITIPEHTDDLWDEKMMRNRMENLRIQFSHLEQECKNNPNYTLDIGIELGIEKNLHLIAVRA